MITVGGTFFILSRKSLLHKLIIIEVFGALFLILINYLHIESGHNQKQVSSSIVFYFFTQVLLGVMLVSIYVIFINLGVYPRSPQLLLILLLFFKLGGGPIIILERFIIKDLSPGLRIWIITLHKALPLVLISRLGPEHGYNWIGGVNFFLVLNLIIFFGYWIVDLELKSVLIVSGSFNLNWVILAFNIKQVLGTIFCIFYFRGVLVLMLLLRKYDFFFRLPNAYPFNKKLNVFCLFIFSFFNLARFPGTPFFFLKIIVGVELHQLRFNEEIFKCINRNFSLIPIELFQSWILFITSLGVLYIYLKFMRIESIGQKVSPFIWGPSGKDSQNLIVQVVLVFASMILPIVILRVSWVFRIQK